MQLWLFGRVLSWDVRGRLLRRLLHDVIPVGLNQIVWDGTDAAGRRVGAGVYFLQMDTAGFRAASKMMIMQ